MTESIKITINNHLVTCRKGEPLQQVLMRENLEDSLCFHPYLKPVPGAVHTCGVLCVNQDKIILACLESVEPSMVLSTLADRVLSWREHMYTAIAAEHPIESDMLQSHSDQSLQEKIYKYGVDKPFKGKSLPPSHGEQLTADINYYPDRCVGCGQCIGYANQIMNNHTLQLFRNPSKIIVGAVPEKTFKGSLTGNIADLCPSGVFEESMSHSKSSSVDHIILDTTNGWGQNVFASVSEHGIDRIKPQKINGFSDWITDICRFSVEGFHNNRIQTPFIKKDGKLQSVEWGDALKFLVRNMLKYHPKEMGFLLGNPVDMGTALILGDFLDTIGVYNRDITARPAGIFQPHCMPDLTVDTISEADFGIFVGNDILNDFPHLHMEFHKNSRAGHGKTLLTLDNQSLENALLNPSKSEVSKILKQGKRGIIMVADYVLSSSEGPTIYEALKKLGTNNHLDTMYDMPLYILHSDITTKGAVRLQFRTSDTSGLDAQGIRRMVKGRQLKFLYTINDDNLVPQDLEDVFFVYQGSHMDPCATHADVVLPAMLSAEENSFYMGQSGDILSSGSLLCPIPHAKPNWKIVRALTEVAGHKADYNHIQAVKKGIMTALENQGLTDSCVVEKRISAPLTWKPTKGRHPVVRHTGPRKNRI